MYAEKSSKFIIFTNYKNLLYFINTKKFNKRQIKWSKMLKQYKFTIRYTSKKNDKTNALNKRNDYMKNKNIINHSIFKINDNESLLINIQKINAILKIFNDDQKQYLIIKNWLHISKKHINKIIKKYHDELLQKYFEIFKTLQFLRRHCQFYNMRQKIEIYIKKYFNC